MGCIGTVEPLKNPVEHVGRHAYAVILEFYGDSIRTSGLLTGQDIFKNLADRKNGDCVFLPKNCVNDQQIFLDDWTVQEMQEKLAVPVRVIGNDFSEILTTLESFES